MCTPEAYIAATIAQNYTQYQAAKDAAADVNRRSDIAAASLRQSEIYDQNAIIRKREVEKQKAAKDKFDIAVRGKKKKGQVSLLAGEKNIAGNVLDTLIGEVEREVGYAFTNLDINYENLMRGYDANALATNQRYNNQILSLPRASKPSWETYAINAGVSIASMYAFNAAPKGSPSPSFDGAGSMAAYQNNPTAYSGSF